MHEHRVMTVREPYASLLVHGLKQYETRSQPQGYRGLVFIHAGMRMNDELRAAAERCRWRLRAMGIMTASDPQWFSKLTRGAIIGAALLTECHTCFDLIEDSKLSSLEEAAGFWDDEHFAWRMESPVVFSRPVACRGALGLTRLKGDVLARAMIQLREDADDALFNRLTNGMLERKRSLSAIEAELNVTD